MVNIRQGFSAVTKAFTMVDDQWLDIILSAESVTTSVKILIQTKILLLICMKENKSRYRYNNGLKSVITSLYNEQTRKHFISWNFYN